MGQGQFQTDSEYAASQGLLDLDDLKSAKFGTGKDFRIWYTGGNARLVCADGDIQFRHATSYDTAEGGETFDPDNQDKMMHLNDDAGVECFYADSLKFETTSDGAKVTGTLEITGDFEPEKIVMKDDKKIEFGDGTDLIIEHDTASDPDCNLINSTDEILRFSSTHSTNNHPYGFSFDQHIRLPRDKRIEFAECDVAGLQNPSDVGLFIEHDTSADPDINIIDSSDHTLKFKSSNGTYGFDFDNHIRLPDDKRIELGGNQDLKIEHDTANDPDCNIIDSSNEFLKFKSSHGTYGFEFDNHIRIPDDKRIEFGNSQDFIIEYDGASDPDCGLIQVTDKPIALRSNHSNYGVEINNHVRLPDDKRIEFGNNQDLTIEHDTASDPDCNIIDSTNDYLKFKSTHGTYGFEFNNHVRLPDDKRIELGNSQDLTIEHDTASDPDCNIIDSTDEYLKFKSSHGTYGFSFDNHVRLPKDKRLELGDSQEFTLEYDESADPDQAEIKCASSRIKMQSNVAITLEETDGTNMIIAEKDGKSALYYAGDNKLETKSDGVKITGDLEITGDFEPDDIDLSDSGKIKLGTGDDLEIYHDGSNGYIKNTGDGNLFIAGHDDCHIYIRAKSGENSIICYDDAGVELYEDNDLRFATTDYGAYVTGRLNLSGSFSSDGGHVYASEKVYAGRTHGGSYHDGKNYIESYFTSSNYTYIAGENSNNSDHVFKCQIGGDTTIKFEAEGDAYWDGDGDSGGADYAEFFEWEDGNPSNQDRRGYPAILSNGKVRIATDSDPTSSIIGIISSVPAFIGNAAPNSWHGKFKRDEFGTFIREDEELLVWNTEDPQPNPNKPEELARADNRVPVKDLDTADAPEWAKTNNLRRTRQVKVIDSTYDPALIYQNRKDRKEWACVGLCGQIPLRKNQPAGDRWLKVKEMNTNLDMWIVRG